MARVSSPQLADSPRDRLIAAGVRLLRSDGPGALQARRVCAEVGVSTMAVYTHFGGMTGLLEAIVAESFARFGEALAAVPATDDPMADFFVMGYAYRRFALDDPHRYRLMFRLDLPQACADQEAGLPVAAATFNQLVTALQRIIDTGRIRADDPVDLAGRMWSMVHGIALLEIVGNFESDGSTVTRIMGPMTQDIFVGMGDDRARVDESMHRARAAIALNAAR